MNIKLTSQQAAKYQGSFLIKEEAQKLWLGLCPRQLVPLPHFIWPHFRSKLQNIRPFIIINFPKPSLFSTLAKSARIFFTAVLILAQIQPVFAETAEITQSDSNPVLQQDVNIGSAGTPPPLFENISQSTSTLDSIVFTQQQPQATTSTSTLDNLSLKPVDTSTSSTTTDLSLNILKQVLSENSSDTPAGASSTPQETAIAPETQQPLEIQANCRPANLPDSQQIDTASTTLDTSPSALSGLLPQSDNSQNATTTQTCSQNNIDIVNTNSVKVDNQADTGSSTGFNKINSQEDGKNSVVDTGDINVYANVLNVVNTNLTNSKIVEMLDNFNGLTADIILNSPDSAPTELAQNLVAGICNSVECKSFNSFTLTNNNQAEVNNDVNAVGHTGSNQISAGQDAENAQIKTGNVNAVVNVLNIVNSNLFNSRWTIASVNIFGSWQGDLVLPSELYFLDRMSIGNNPSQNNLNNIDKVVLNVQNDNQAEFNNNVATISDTGNNSIDATGAPDGKKGDAENSQITTGDAQSGSVVKNYANTNLFGGAWFLGIINTLGSWSGNIYSLPDQVAMANTPTGMTFFSVQGSKDESYKILSNALTDNTSADSTATSTTDTQINIDNQNTAKITNNVNVGAFTGDNSITGQETENGKISTGNAKALANILNFANTNLINSDLQVGIINIFGSWNGNVVFGYPDLSVTQKLASDKYPKEKGKPVNFEMDFSNTGQASMKDTLLEFQYDPSQMKFESFDSTIPFTQPQDGAVNFDLGKLSPNSSGKITVSMSTLADLDEGFLVRTFTRISGTGPEKNKTNNEFVLETAAATTGAANNGGGGNGGNGGGSGGGGGGGNSSSSPLKVYKTNNATGPATPGSKVAFKLVIDNNSGSTLSNVNIYDTLRDPNNNIIYSKTFNLGNMAGTEEAVINYDVDIAANATPGTYTNSAYAQGVNIYLNTVKSDVTALSSFTVSGGGSSNNNQNSNDNAKLTNQNTLAGTTSDNTQGTPPAALQQIVKTSKPEQPKKITAKQIIPEVLSAFADTAKADSGIKNINPLPAPQNSQPSFWSAWAPVRIAYLVLVLAFLLAVGYVIRNMFRKTGTEEEFAGLTAVPPEEPIENFEIFPIAATPRKRGRPRKIQPPNA